MCAELALPGLWPLRAKITSTSTAPAASSVLERPLLLFFEYATNSCAISSGCMHKVVWLC